MVMFCPNAADWGNVADWVSGIGSSLAVVTALGIAIHQARSANKLERSRVKVEAYRRNSLLDEADALIEEAQGNASQFALKMEMSAGLSTTPRKLEYIAAQRAVGTRLLQLQELERTNPGVFTELGRLASMLTVQQDPRTDSDSAFGFEAKSLRDRLGVRRTTLSEIRAVLDENDAA